MSETSKPTSTLQTSTLHTIQLFEAIPADLCDEYEAFELVSSQLHSIEEDSKPISEDEAHNNWLLAFGAIRFHIFAYEDESYENAKRRDIHQFKGILNKAE